MGFWCAIVHSLLTLLSNSIPCSSKQHRSCPKEEHSSKQSVTREAKTAARGREIPTWQMFDCYKLREAKKMRSRSLKLRLYSSSPECLAHNSGSTNCHKDTSEIINKKALPRMVKIRELRASCGPSLNITDQRDLAWKLSIRLSKQSQFILITSNQRKMCLLLLPNQPHYWAV